mgnify:CR=1 FL=1
MGLFSSAPKTVRVDTSAKALRVDAGGGKPWSLWSDGLGVLAIRALQIMIVVAIAAASGGRTTAEGSPL